SDIIILFFFLPPATTEIYTLSLHDALPIFYGNTAMRSLPGTKQLIHPVGISPFSFWISLNYLTNVSITKERLSAIYHSRLIIPRSEEHTSELQSRENLVCRLLLEKKNNK